MNKVECEKTKNVRNYEEFNKKISFLIMPGYENGVGCRVAFGRINFDLWSSCNI